MKSKALIVDIDGTLSDDSHRRHLVLKKPKNFAEYYSLLSMDTLNSELNEYLKQQHAEGMEIIYLTGRPDRYRGPTLTWLLGHDCPNGFLYMRRDNDMRPAPVYKLDAWKNRLSEIFEVKEVIDDDPRVIDAFKNVGMTLTLVGKGDR